MSLLKTPWFTLVELPVAAGAQQRQNFPDQPDLTTLVDQEIRILGIELFTSDVLSNAPSGQALAPIAELQKATLVLFDDDLKKIYQYPVLGLNRMYSDPAAFFPHQFDLQLFQDLRKIAWTKSGVEYMVPPANLPYSIVFGVHYEKLKGEEVKKF